jgi:hypothetical protein
MLITTPKTNQSAIIKYYSNVLETNKDVSIIKSSRGGMHLRINYKGDFYQLMNSIHPCEIKASDNNISGSFVTYELQIKSPISGANIGDKIYFVVTVSSKGVVSNKELTPDKLGLTNRDIFKTTLLTEARSSVNRSKVPPNIKSFLNDLLDASVSTGGIIKSEHLESISDSDLNIIAKDFGEISGAVWYMNQFNKNSDSVKYPPDIGNPLVDYYVKEGTKTIAISAKANKGAPPSINAIAQILSKMRYNEAKKEGARKAIIAISEKSTVEGIVEAAKNLNTPGYQWLKKNIFKNMDFTAAQCETALAYLKTPEQALSLLSPFYSLINRSASKEITERIFKNKAKRYGLIISPLGYSLVDELNSLQVYKDVLNDAAKSIMVSQLYMSINKSSKTVNYSVKEFSASSFKFLYNANAGEPSLKKISFKMET